MATALASVVSNALLARLLSPQDLGAYFLALSVVTLGSIAGSLGLSQAVVRFVAENMALGRSGRARRTARTVLGFGVLGALGVGILYLILGGFIAGLFGSPGLAATTGLVAGWMVMLSLQQLSAEVFRGFHDIRSATIFGGLATGALLMACLTPLWLIDGRASLSAVILLAACSSLTSTLLAVWALRRKIGTPTRQEDTETGVGTGELFRVAWPLLVTTMTVVVLTQVDLWIVGAFLSPEEVAIYGAAVRLVALLTMPILVVNAVVSPLIAEMYAQGRKRELERVLRTAATLTGVPSFLVVVGFVLFSEPLLSLVYGSYYRESATVLILLSLGQLANVWAGSCGQTLIMTGHQSAMMKITVIGGLLVVVGALWAVRSYGTVGVASVAALGLVLQNASMLLVVKKKTTIWTHITFSLSSIRRIIAQ